MNNTLVPRSRPLGITIIAVLVAIGGILGVILSIIGLVALGGRGVSGLVIIALLLSIVQLILAWGLWTLRPWAFWVTVALEALSVIEALILVFNGANIGSTIAGVILPIIILVYLFADRNVRAAFRT